MKILLISIDSKYIHSNLAVNYLKNYCIENESNLNKVYEIKIKEFTINQQSDYILREIYNENPDLICFSSYVWNIEYIKEIAYTLKVADENLKILLGGPEVSYNIRELMNEYKFIDYIIYGEGEITFKEFIETLHSTNLNFKNIKGLAYKENSTIIINDQRDLIQNLDIIKPPYNIKDLDEKFEDKIIYYESSRGCPFRCSFCMSSIDKSVRYFSIERVKQDLKILLNTNARQIKFVDRTFNSNYRRAMEIMSYIVENNIKRISIHLEITADIINEEFLNYLIEMPINMFQFEIGVQSLNIDTLRAINRNMNIDRLFYIIDKLKKNANIHLHLDLIAGLPYESYEQFKNSFNGVYELAAQKLQLGFLKVLKGTNIYEDKIKYSIEYKQIAPYEVIKTKHLNFAQMLKLKAIEELIDKYYNEKYFDKSLEYIISRYYEDSPFSFYEDFGIYWNKKDLYKASYSRKKLYEILYNFIKEEKKDITDKFLDSLVYDYVFNNKNEELPQYLDKNKEESLKQMKRILATEENFRNKYFVDIPLEEKIINKFRLVNIGDDIVLFTYEEKDNIFNRCKTYTLV